MLSARTLKALSGINKASIQGYKVKKLHKLMCNNLDLWATAYANIYSNFIDPLPNTFKYTSRTELLDRMTARKCEYCGIQSGYLEVHHVRKLKDIKGDAEPWKRLMISRKRKTLVLCKDCHIDLHRGKLPDYRNFAKV